MYKRLSHLTCLIALILVPQALASAGPSLIPSDDDRSSAVVLMYHHFGETRYPSTNIRLEQFEAHLTYLEDNNFQVLPLEQIISTLKAGKALPDKSIAITMDDAYRSIYSQAYPRLKAKGWPFTVFVSTDYIDKRYSNYLTWAQMREMEAHGARYGNHSASHSHLINKREGEDDPTWLARIRADLEKAQTRLTEELKHPLPFLAYPYGEYNLAVTALVADMGLVGIGQHSGAMGTTSDFRYLPRFPMAEAFGELEGFIPKVNSLAMPLSVTPQLEPSGDEPRPTLKLEISASHAPLNQLACYASGQGRMEVTQIGPRSYSTQAKDTLPPGRSRYNCTAPSDVKGRFYWFSQPWIRPGGSDADD